MPCLTRETGWDWRSRPEQQLRFFRLTGDLPARREAWRDTAFTHDPFSRAFEIQLGRTVPTPAVPEWENISLKLQDKVESMVLGHVIDLADHYSQLANYMRLNNILPPTALPRPNRAGN